MQYQIHEICFIYIFYSESYILAFSQRNLQAYKKLINNMLFQFNLENDNKFSQVTGWAGSHLGAAKVSELKLSEAKLILCLSDHFPQSHETKEGLKKSKKKQITHEKSLN